MGGRRGRIRRAACAEASGEPSWMGDDELGGLQQVFEIVSDVSATLVSLLSGTTSSR